MILKKKSITLSCSNVRFRKSQVVKLVRALAFDDARLTIETDDAIFPTLDEFFESSEPARHLVFTRHDLPVVNVKLSNTTAEIYANENDHSSFGLAHQLLDTAKQYKGIGFKFFVIVGMVLGIASSFSLSFFKFDLLTSWLGRLSLFAGATIILVLTIVTVASSFTSHFPELQSDKPITFLPEPGANPIKWRSAIFDIAKILLGVIVGGIITHLARK